MVIENAVITIDPARADAFERAVAEGAAIFRVAEGCRSMALHRIVDDPARYRLLVSWDSIAHHVPMFWESPGFKAWQGLVAGFFIGVPSLEYNDVAGNYF